MPASPGCPRRAERSSRLVRHERRLAADFVPDLNLMRWLADRGEADDDAHRGNDHRVNQPAESDAGGLLDRRPDKWDATAKPAVANMVGHRHRAIADAGWEQLDKEGSDRPVHH